MNTYRKLSDGSWGLAVRSGAKTGDVVTVVLKNGSTKTETLGEHLGSSYGDCENFRIAPKATAVRATAQVGNLSGVLALFEKAKQHLKYPAIVMSVPAAGSLAIRINVAGEQARVPGSLNVTNFEKPTEGRRQWFGRIHRSGEFERTDAATDAIVDRLVAFAADPAGVAAEHGRLTGRCCFCNQALTDERSTAVGYGSTCADHYGLPWGARPTSFAAQA